MQKKFELHKYILRSEETIIKAITNLQKTKNKFCLILDRRNKFLGTLVDGDIRRGFLKHYNINDKIEKFVNKKSIVTFQELSNERANIILKNEQINCLPLINKNRKLINVYLPNIGPEIKFIKNEMLIMAGGKGMRLRPLTYKTPKPLLIVNGSSIIEQIIFIAKKQGIRKFHISIHYLGYKIKRFLGDGSKYDVKINYLEEKKPFGTAGSIKLLKNFKKPIVVSNSDVISNINFYEMIKYHNRHKSLITVSAKIFNEKNNYGKIILKGERISKIIEKPKNKFLINAGIYIVSPRIKKYLRSKNYFDMTDLIDSAIKTNDRIHVFPLYENWYDYGIKENFGKK